jgi:hypothetical protein
MLRRILDSPWAGAVGAIGAFLWEGFWLMGPPIGLTARERTPYLVWGLAALGICAYQSFAALLRENDRLGKQLDEKEKNRKAREAIGKLLEQLAQYERDAYSGATSAEYDRLIAKTADFKSAVKQVATDYLDSSFESRVLAVNVHDTPLDEATKDHFIVRAQGSFWAVYQQLKGWRICLVDILRDMSR